jgi:hypothetical protein
VNWIQAPYDGYQWRTLVNTIMKPSGSIKGGELLDQLIDNQVLKEYSVP